MATTLLDVAHARAWHWVRCACGGALALAACTAVLFVIGAAFLSILPDRYDNLALVGAVLAGGVLVLTAFVLPQRLSWLALCTGCALLLAVGGLLLY